MRGATIVSLQNGVDNAARMRPLVDAEVVAAVVYVGCQMAGPGHVRHTGRGDLVVGGSGGAGMERAAAVAALFERAGVPCRVSDNVDGELWTKLIINCAYNAVVRFTPPLRSDDREPVVARGDAAGRGRGRGGGARRRRAPRHRRPDGRVWKIGEAMPAQISSTAQDIGFGKPTEIDALNGYVARRGEALGVPAPVNRTLHALVKLLELAARKG